MSTKSGGTEIECKKSMCGWCGLIKDCITYHDQRVYGVDGVLDVKDSHYCPVCGWGLPDPVEEVVSA